MDSTPDEPEETPGGAPEEPDAGGQPGGADAGGADAGGADAGGVTPPDAAAPFVPPAPYSGVPPVIPPVPPRPVLPGQPPVPPPGAGLPPGAPPYGAPYGAPPYGAQYGPPPPGYPTTPQRNGLSFGAGIGVGAGIGCGLYLLGGVLLFTTIGVIGNAFGFLWPFILIALAAVVMMFFRRTRGVATGILIVSAAAWIVVLGPCIALIGGV